MQCPTHGAFCGICHPPHNVLAGLYYAVDVFIHPPWFRAISGAFLHKENGRTPSVNQLSAFPSIQPGPSPLFLFSIPSSCPFYGWQYPAAHTHTHTHTIWLDVTKHERWKNHPNKERGQDMTGRRIIAHVRYISPTLAYMYKFSSFEEEEDDGSEVRHVSVK